MALHPQNEERYVSVCSGGGGLDVGVRLAFPGARCVCYVEREAPAVAALVAAMEAGALDEAPVWSDAATFDGRRWRGRVAGVVGGTPCQDLSLAGRRAGLHGSRSGLFFEFVRIVRECEPEWCVWENVGGATSALPAVFAEFGALGYRGAWCRIRASDVGATHERARVFLLAHRDNGGWSLRAGTRSGDAGQPRASDHGAADNADALAYRDGAALGQQPGRSGGQDGPGAAFAGLTGAEGDSGAVGHGHGPGLEERGALEGDSGAQRATAGGAGMGGLPPWPPGPADVEGWRRVLAVAPWLAPALFNDAVSWADTEEEGAPSSDAQPGIRSVVDGMAVASGGLDRIEILRLLGNGVVPAQAAAALYLLSNHLRL